MLSSSSSCDLAPLPVSVFFLRIFQRYSPPPRINNTAATAPRMPGKRSALAWLAESWTQTPPRSKEAVLYSTGLLTKQTRLAWGWPLGKLTARMHELQAGSNVLLCSHSLGRPLFSQVTFRSPLAPEALHSRVTLHQSGVMDVGPIRIWGEGTGS